MMKCAIRWLGVSLWCAISLALGSQNASAQEWIHPTDIMAQTGPRSLPEDNSLASTWLQPNQDGVVHIAPQDAFLQIRGWIEGGYTFNTDTPSTDFNGPYNAIDRDIPLLNQFYLILERPMQSLGHGWNLGGRVDLLYGYDYFLTQSTGLERDQDGSTGWNQDHHGLALPQIYAEIGKQDFSVKLGHFYTIVGYEGVPSLNNFFYSKSYAYQFAGPFTHWGGLLKWRPSRHWRFHAGVHNGWDTLKRKTKNRPGVLLGFDYDNPDNLWNAGVALTTGHEPSARANQVDNRTRYSVIFKLRPIERIEYVLHHHFAFQENGTVSGNMSQWYGIDQYVFYQIRDHWKAGLRFEWFRDDDGTRVSGATNRVNPNVGSFAGNFFSLAFGVNVSPHPNVLLRPEVRSDWFTGNRRPFDDGKERNQILLAINALVQF